MIRRPVYRLLRRSPRGLTPQPFESRQLSDHFSLVPEAWMILPD
ncbi:MAG TPA: hypothetical protein VK138_16265 [Acidiferrobacterales bacterium]|nr:hypothetical protein [Acidiferrobacterales bacterium]